MDPTLFPFAGGGVPFLNAPGMGDVPQQPPPAQAPGFFGGLRNRIFGAPGTVAPDPGSMGAQLPFVSPNQSFGANPLATKETPDQTELPPNATSTVGQGAPQGQQTGNKLMDALRGVKAPAPPQAQTVRTPPPPQLAPIKGGEFVAMLSSLGITPQEFLKMRMGGLGGR